VRESETETETRQIWYERRALREWVCSEMEGEELRTCRCRGCICVREKKRGREGDREKGREREGEERERGAAHMFARALAGLGRM
jgi:hypothetical protein